MKVVEKLFSSFRIFHYSPRGFKITKKVNFILCHFPSCCSRREERRQKELHCSSVDDKEKRKFANKGGR